jgi:hypothetical protein
MKKQLALSILSLFVLQAVSCFGTTIKYVTHNGSGNYNGSSWSDALPGDSLQYAINTSTGGQVWVATGTYYPTQDSAKSHVPLDPRDKTFTLRSNVAVYGGFAGNETSIEQRPRSDRDGDSKIEAWEFTHETILSGEIQQDADSSNNVYHVVLQKDKQAEGIVVDGFTVRDGFAAKLFWNSSNTHLQCDERAETSNGGGMYVYNATISRCVIRNNSGYGYGAGLMLVSGLADSSYFEGNAFIPISASNAGYGGGAFINEIGTISNSVFEHNDAPIGSAVFLNAGGNITSCVIIKNTGRFCIGANRGGSLVNTLVADNTGHVWLSQASIVSCTFARNKPSYLSQSTVLNSVLLDGFEESFQNSNAPTSCRYSLVKDKVSDTITNILAPVNFSASTYFADEIDYKLHGKSPLINAGMPNVGSLNQVTIDRLGNPRISYGRIDIGAHEHFSRTFFTPLGAGAGNGTSWDNAMAGSLLNDVAGKGAGEIWMSGGTYEVGENSIVLSSNLRIIGGFAGTESDPAQRLRIDTDKNGMVEAWEFAHPTIVQPDLTVASPCEIVIDGTSASQSSLLDGLIVQNAQPVVFVNWLGETFFNGGIALQLRSGTVRNCTFRNALHGSSNVSLNSAVSLSGDARIEYCLITDNIAISGGGLELLGNSIAQFCVIRNNKTEQIGGSSGGGVAMGGNSLLAESQIVNNYNNGKSNSGDAHGGGVSMKGGTIRNCVIANNTTEGEATRGGGVFIWEHGTSTIINTVIVNNNVIGTYAHGDDLGMTLEANIQNSIFGSQPFLRSINTHNRISYCAAPAVFAGYGVDSIFAFGDMDELYSQFVSPTTFVGNATNAQDSLALLSADWRLKNDSWFVNKGYFAPNDPILPAVDADSTARVKHETIDLGAYEFQIPRPVSLNLETVQLGTANTVFAWNNAPAHHFLLFVLEGTDGRLVLDNGTDYVANREFGQGLSVNGWYCVYKGRDTLAAITGLLKGTRYKAMVVAAEGVNYHVYNTDIVDNVHIFTTRRDQTITFNLPSTATAGNSFIADVSATSGLDIVLTSPDSEYIAIQGTKITILQAVDTPVFVSVTASQYGNSAYDTAQPITKTITLSKASQSVSFLPIADKIFGDEMFVPVARASSGLPVRFALSTDTVVAFVGSSLQIIGDGEVTITASQDGDSVFAQAKDVSQTFSVAKSPQTISFLPIADRIYTNELFVPVVKASSGLPVDLELDNDSVVRFEGTSLQIIGHGSVTITASQIGNQHFSEAKQVSQTFSVSKAPQVINLNPIGDRYFGNEPIVPIVSTSSNLVVGLTSSNESVAIIENGRIRLVGVGTVRITAWQPGNARWLAAQDTSVSFSVIQAPQYIEFAAFPNITYGDMQSMKINAVASSRLALSYQSSNEEVATVRNDSLIIHGVGSTVIGVGQEGNVYYEPATQQYRVLTVGKIAQKLEYTSALPDTLSFKDTVLIASIVSDINLPVQLLSLNEQVAVIEDGKIRIIGAGTTIISARQLGNDTVLAATNVDHRLVVLQKIQSIAVTANAIVEFGSQDLEIVVQSSSNVPVSLQSRTPNIVQIVNGKVQVVGTGDAKIRLTQEAVAGYKAIDTVITITVTKAKDSVTFTALPNKLLGQKDFTLTAESKSGGPVKFFSSNSAVASIIEDEVTINGAGSCTISAIVYDSKNYVGDTVQQTFTVSALNVLKMPSYATTRDTVIDLNALRLNADEFNYSFVSAKYNTVSLAESKASIVPRRDTTCWTGTDTLLFKAVNKTIETDSVAFAIKVTRTRYADEIGLVTTDSLTGTYNIIAWEPQQGASTAQWIVCRRSQSLSQWEQIDTVQATDSSYSVDNRANTRQQAYQYALKTVDSYGCVSPLSAHHTTMHLKTGVSLQGLPQLWWTPYEGMDVDAYIIYRKNAETQQYDPIGSTFLTSFTDQYPNGTTSYRVAIRFAKKVVASRLKTESGPFSQSLSNLSEAIIMTIGRNSEGISLSPNPVASLTKLDLPAQSCTVTVTDLHGRIVLPVIEASGSTIIDASPLALGAYTVSVSVGDEVYTLTLIKTDGAK